MKDEKKLFLLDAFALIYRAYYAFIKNPRINSKGQNTSAVFGFINTLEEVLRRENPTHIAVAFDPSGPTFRSELFEAYKAHREETPEVIRQSVPIIKKIIKAYNIPILEYKGFEADDVIGTFAKMAESRGFTTYMMTPDKDYAQLVSDNIFMLKPKSMGNEFEILGVEEVKTKFEVSSADQIIDLLGLMGDSADNIPGCPGVGPKTAVKLLAEYGSIENILANTHELKGSLKEKVENNKELILLSKLLATIKIDVPVEFDESDLIRSEIDEEKLGAIFEELEFKNLRTRVFKTKEVVEKKPSAQGSLFDLFEANESEEIKYSTLSDINSTPHQYYLLDNQDKIGEFITKISVCDFASFDTETTGVDPITAELVGLSFSMQENEAFYIPLPPNREKAIEILNLLKPFYENENILKIGQNIKYDYIVLRNYGIEVKGKFFDTMVAHYLLQPEVRHNMDLLAEIYLQYRTVHIDELIGAKGKNQKSMRDLLPEQVYEYACEDADVTLKLKNVFEKELVKNELVELFYDIEMPLVLVLADMELNGIRLDSIALKESSIHITERLINIENEIFEMAGATFNINSAQQVGDILFDKLKIVEKTKKTKTGQYSTSEEVLESLKGKHPIVEKILDYRGLKKLLSTYINALPELVNKKSGKIHSSFNQTVTATGRLSSTNPNLQNIPIRDEDGKEIRRAFIPEIGCKFLSADYSQIELRIMAHLSNDANMVDAFLSDEDIHTATSAKIFKVPLNEVTKDMRRKAKTANFGIIYGISIFGLSERLTIPRSEAKYLIDSYFESYPEVKNYMDSCIVEAKKQGYVLTLLKRKRMLPDINSGNSIVRGYAERNAINAPIQGSAADIIKIAMVRIFKRFKDENIQSKMILQVHDELNFSVLESELEQVKQIVVEEMEGAYPLSVPLKAECGVGKNWLEAH
jgi:DNA polymerase-1